MSLSLSLPQSGESLKLKTDIRPKQVKSWLENLPLTNIMEAANSVSEALTSLNRMPVKDHLRLELLELFFPAIDNLVQELKPKYILAALPMPEKSRQAANLSRTLYTELAYGYKLLLLERLGKRLSLRGTHLHLIIQRTLAALSKLLCVFYNTYSPTPAGIWSEIHQLAHMALQRNLHDELVDGGKNSISSTYKQILLLALANPYKLMQGEVGRVNDYLATHSKQAKLYPLQPVQGTSGLFLIDLESDSPPKSADQEGDIDPRTHILIGTDTLVTSLHDLTTKLESGRSPKQLNLPDYAKEAVYLNLLRRLLKDWVTVPRRKFKRIANSDTMEVCVGLRATFHFLSLTESEIQTLDFSDNRAAEFAAVKNTAVQFSISPWSVTNESASGLRLKRISGSNVQVRVGDVIGMCPQGTLKLSIAVVRWVNYDETENVEVGVQMLAPSATAVTLKPVVSGPRDIFRAALLLPEIRPLQQPASIIASPATFRTKLEYLLYENGVVSNVRGMRLIEQTASFDQFQYSVE